MYDELELEKRLTALEIRVGQVETVVDEIRTLSSTMTRMCVEIKHLTETVNRLDARVESIESEPASRWSTVKTVVITAVISGLVGMFINSLF